MRRYFIVVAVVLGSLLAACRAPGIASQAVSPIASQTAAETPRATPTPCTQPSALIGCLTTIAGGGPDLVDGGKATASALCEPTDIAVDGAGNVYFANAGTFCSGPAGNRVLRVDPNGNVAVVAGTGTRGFSGDGGPATNAEFNQPVWLAVDRAGSLYIADTNNYRIRRVDSKGIISTFAGSGKAGYSGDGGPARAAQLFAREPEWCDIPGGMAFDPKGNLYLADAGAVRKIDLSGKITTVAGTGRAGFSGDGGPATEAGLCASDVALDCAGNLYVSGGGERVRRVDVAGLITTVAGGADNTNRLDGGPATEAWLRGAWGIAVDSHGNLFIAEHRTNRIRRVGRDGIITTVAGILHPSSGGRGLFNGENGYATEVHLNEPVGVYVDANDVLYIADTFNARIRTVRFAPGS